MKNRLAKLLLPLSLLCSSSLMALEYEPWLPPLGQFQGIFTYDYFNNPLTLNKINNKYSNFFDFGLELSPCPYWDVQAQLDFIESSQTSFTLGAFEMLARYQWRGNVIGECYSVVTGMSMAFIRQPMLYNENAYLDSYFNVGFNATIGREFYTPYSCLWKRRIWLYMEYFVYNNDQANQFRFTVDYDQRIFPRVIWKLDLKYFTSNGYKDFPSDPSDFHGYDRIDFSAANLETRLKYETPCWGTIEMGVFYNVMAQNSPQKFWGLELKLIYPFCI